MTTKLTLTIEKETIKRAKHYAKETQRSLSELIQKYLDNLTKDEIEVKDQFPDLQKFIGIAKMPKTYTDDDLENDKREYLEKKYR